MASRMRVTSLTATVVGCPTWIRTRTKASKGPCATVTPSDKPHKTVAFNAKSAKKNFCEDSNDYNLLLQMELFYRDLLFDQITELLLSQALIFFGGVDLAQIGIVGLKRARAIEA